MSECMNICECVCVYVVPKASSPVASHPCVLTSFHLASAPQVRPPYPLCILSPEKPKGDPKSLETGHWAQMCPAFPGQLSLDQEVMIQSGVDVVPGSDPTHSLMPQTREVIPFPISLSPCLSVSVSFFLCPLFPLCPSTPSFCLSVLAQNICSFSIFCLSSVTLPVILSVYLTQSPPDPFMHPVAIPTSSGSVIKTRG